jgi:hypothetical protein
MVSAVSFRSFRFDVSPFSTCLSNLFSFFYTPCIVIGAGMLCLNFFENAFHNILKFSL